MGQTLDAFEIIEILDSLHIPQSLILALNDVPMHALLLLLQGDSSLDFDIQTMVEVV